MLEIARAHHGSLAREERLVVEEQLKAGQIPCIVATSSLELGIDMGAVDLVLQVESPKSVAAGLQRIGRAGHNVGDTSKGRIFPKFRADLLECAVVAQRMREGAIEPTVVPRNPLDVLAQQVVAMAAAEEELNVDELYARVTRTHSYGELGRQQLENVLDMLDGRYPSSEFAELRPRIVWDRIAGVVRPRRGARQLAVTNAGTIPDRGLYMVTLPDGRRVGELDEEMVYEARPGQVFLLGASSWRIEEIGRDRVIVTPAPGVPGAVPFWKGDGIGRPKELGEAIGAFSRWAVEQSAETLAQSHDLDPRAARNLLDFLREQQEATRVIPSDRTIVVERFRDEIGDWRLCILSPYGGRIHAAWGLALSAKIRDELGLEADAIWSDDGIIVHLPDADEPPGAEFALIEPDVLEDAVVAELSSSALFGARFRENAGRALLIPRAYPGKRTPLWQQRLKSQTLLEVAKRYGEFPDHPRDLSRVPAGRPRSSWAARSPDPAPAPRAEHGRGRDADRLAVRLLAAVRLRRDVHVRGRHAQRRAARGGAVARPRPAARAARPGGAARPDRRRRARPGRGRPPAALRADARDDEGRAARRAAPRRRPDERGGGAAGRPHASDAEAWLAELERERRAVRVRVGGEPRWIDAADAGMYRDALGVVPPGGLPEAFVANVPDALVKLLRRYAQTHGPFTTDEPRARFGLDPGPALRALERDGEVVRGELRPGGVSGTREWCDADVLRRLRRASLAVLRREIEPADQRAFATFLPSWQGIDKHPPGGAGIDRLREQLVPLQGLALTPSTWETEVLPRRVGAYSTTWIDQLCASGELVWVGAGALGRTNGKVALYFRDDAALIGPPPVPGRAPALDLPEHLAVRERLAQGSCFFTDLLADLSIQPEQIQEALWDLAWAGEVTNDAFAPLRAPRMTLVRAQRRAAARAGRPGRFSSRRGAGRAEVQGRWSLTAPLFAAAPGAPSDPSARRRALGELLLERYGLVTRELVLAEGVPGGFSALYPELSQLETLGVARRGYFVEGLGGAQFALPGAVERLRAQRAPEESPPIVLAATDPAQPFGAALPWPKRDGETRRPARVPGATVVIAGAAPVLYLERGGKALQVLAADDDARVMAALLALADHTRAGRIRRIALEKVNGEPVMGTRWEAMLAEVGFSAGPKRLTLTA